MKHDQLLFGQMLVSWCKPLKYIVPPKLELFLYLSSPSYVSTKTKCNSHLLSSKKTTCSINNVQQWRLLLTAPILSDTETQLYRQILHPAFHPSTAKNHNCLNISSWRLQSIVLKQQIENFILTQLTTTLGWDQSPHPWVRLSFIEE